MYGLEKYEELISDLKSRKFQFSVDWESILSDTILLRHDIDFSVEDAAKIADLEASLDVKSTFFFMLSSNMYNVLSEANRSLIHQIREMGHKISLHFDPTVSSSMSHFMDEKNVFESAFGSSIDIVSIHRPGVFLKDNNRDLFGVKHTYQDRYFNEMTYISDSGGKNIDDKIQRYTSQSSLAGLHLLLHPIWWTRESNSATATLNMWEEANSNFLKKEIALNCKSYREKAVGF